MEVVASLSQGRTAAAQCGLFTHKSVPVIFEPPCSMDSWFDRLTVHTILSLRMLNIIHTSLYSICRSQWTPGLRRGSTAARLLELGVRIPPGTWTSVSCRWYVLSGRSLCVVLINSCSKPNSSNPQLLTTMSATNLILSFNICGSIKSFFFYSRFLIETFYGFPLHYDTL